jgi:glycosyltransferase involved in cell wall biosynthesis
LKKSQTTLEIRVAITQPAVVFGGRLQVIIGMIKALNELGVIPDVVTSRLAFDPKEISDRYGVEIQANWRMHSLSQEWPNELYTAKFNYGMRWLAQQYDLLTNTSNSLLFLPKQTRVLTYMFFPRKSRILASVANIHRPRDNKVRTLSKRGLYRSGMRLLYRLSKPHPNHYVISMTNFTRDALIQAYPKLASKKIPIVYPPVRLEGFFPQPGKRPPVVTTVGRFDPAKRQLDQIELAAKLPLLDFHIVGFVHDRAYYELCQTHVSAYDLGNVRLYPDVSSEKLQELLRNSRYFLHTTINEPFGITAVQAVAAGNIPLVHDSGGQRETIPIDELRYQSLHDVVPLIENLEDKDPQDRLALIAELQGYIQRFDEAVFVEKMQSIFSSLLGVKA